MNRIRIMHVVDSLGTGGTEGGIRKLLSGLDQSVFEQSVCTVTAKQSPDAGAAGRVVSVDRSSSGNQVLVWRFKQVFEVERPHIVHSRNWGAIEAIMGARLAGVPGVIHSEHGLEASTFRHQPVRRNVIRCGGYALADRVFAVCRSLRGYYAGQVWLGKKGMDVIPNGVDNERFLPRPDLRRLTREALGAKDDTVVIGTVGRLDPIKNHSALFTAVKELLGEGLPLLLVIVGDGPDRAKLENEVRSCRLSANVKFIGNTCEIVSHLNSFDMFVLPSFAEGMSNALLEAMSVGLPCIASEVGGNCELVEHGISGLMFDPKHATELARNIKALIVDVNSRRELGANARKRIGEHFTLDRMLGAYSHMYREVLDKKCCRLAANKSAPFGQNVTEKYMN